MLCEVVSLSEVNFRFTHATINCPLFGVIEARDCSCTTLLICMFDLFPGLCCFFLWTLVLVWGVGLVLILFCDPGLSGALKALVESLFSSIHSLLSGSHEVSRCIDFDTGVS